MKYNIEQKLKLKFQFPNLDLIQENYSETYQDIFVLTMLNGKRDGYFLEIGAMYPQTYSNTYLLESKFGWKGISIEKESHYEAMHKSSRTNKFITGDALLLDYPTILEKNNFPKQIDYLQIDINAESNLKCLQILPMDKYRFSVITFEHNIYLKSNYSFCISCQLESRKIFADLGYVRIAGNISNAGPHDPYEDWWVDPNTIDKTLIEKFKTDNDINIPGGEFLSYK